MLVTHRSLMSPHPPALQERHYAVHPGQELGGGLLLSVKLRDLMDVTFRSQGAVAVCHPSVCTTLPGTIDCATKGKRLSAEASAICRLRILPIRGPSF